MEAGGRTNVKKGEEDSNHHTMQTFIFENKGEKTRGQLGKLIVQSITQIRNTENLSVAGLLIDYGVIWLK